MYNQLCGDQAPPVWNGCRFSGWKHDRVKITMFSSCKNLNTVEFVAPFCSLFWFPYNFSYLFFLNIKNVQKSLKICVKTCPNRTLETMQDICQFYQDTGSRLCHVIPGNEYSACQDEKHRTGSCPKPPVYPSIVILNRCVPKNIKDVGAAVISNLYGLINSWDVIEQILGDLYKTWREIAALSFLAFGKHTQLHVDIHSAVNDLEFCFSFISVHDRHFSPVGQHRELDCYDPGHNRVHRWVILLVQFLFTHFSDLNQLEIRWYRLVVVDVHRD